MTSRQLESNNRKAAILALIRAEPHLTYAQVAERVGGCGMRYVSEIAREAGIRKGKEWPK